MGGSLSAAIHYIPYQCFSNPFMASFFSLAVFSWISSNSCWYSFSYSCWVSRSESASGSNSDSVGSSSDISAARPSALSRRFSMLRALRAARRSFCACLRASRRAFRRDRASSVLIPFAMFARRRTIMGCQVRVSV